MASALDVVFAPVGSWEIDSLILELVLASPRPLGRVIVVSAAASLDRRLADRLATAAVSWESIDGKTLTEAINRGLLLAANDVLVLSDGYLPLPSTIAALDAVLAEEDRAGVVVPMVDDTGTSEKDLERFLSQYHLPPREKIPAPPCGVLLIRQSVLAMTGALDERLTGALDALGDFCLRAQRLGFVTVREPRAWVSRSRHSFPPDFPASPELVERHPYFAMQRLLAVEGVRGPTVQRALASSRSGPVIGLDLRYLPEGAINGTSVYAVELIKAMLAHTPAKLVLCVATEGQKAALSTLGVPVHLNTFPPEVTLVHRPAQVFRPTDLTLLLQTHAPYVLSYQDLIAYRAGSVFSGDGSDQLKYQMASWVAVKGAQGLIAISHHNKGEVVREFGVDADDVHVVHHGVDHQAFARRPDESEAEDAALRGLNLPRRFFLFIGSDYAHKNVQLLLTAYATFRSRLSVSDEKPGLVLVGHPSGTQHSLFPRLRERPLVGVHYVGGVSHEVLRALYHRATAFVYLSAYEGFGLPLLEAMAAETPILCTQFSSIPEVSGEACLKVTDLRDDHIADQLVALSQQPGLRERLAAAGLERVKPFTWKRTAVATFEAYEAVLKRPSARSFAEREWLNRLVHRPLLP
jgi:glycosyltransferase involved in cell wall biosynthesis